MNQLAPFHPLPYIALGIDKYNRGFYDPALDCLEKAMSLAPNDPTAKLAYCECLLGINGPDAASHTLEQLSRDFPNNARVHYIQAEFARARGEYSTAQESYRTALALDPTLLIAKQRILDLALCRTISGRIAAAIHATVRCMRSLWEDSEHASLFDNILTVCLVYMTVLGVLELLWLTAFAEAWLLRRLRDVPRRLVWQFTLSPLPAAAGIALTYWLAPQWRSGPAELYMTYLTAFWSVAPLRRVWLSRTRKYRRDFILCLVILVVQFGLALVGMQYGFGFTFVSAVPMAIVSQLAVLHTVTGNASPYAAARSSFPALTQGPLI
jgi:tetratricopeptide (TPR) repeat protein